jgi:3-oxoacyl-[acyl-carrier protein] reductase
MQTNQIDLQRRKAIVTGGASGLGFAIAKRLLQSGAEVALWDSKEEALDRAAAELSRDGDVRTLVVDVADQGVVRAACVRSVAELGCIDILINSAGIAGPAAPVVDYALSDWQAVLNVNLTGTFNCIQALLPHMMERDYGRVINIASVAGKDGNPNASAYSASKAGVMALTKSVAKEVAKTGIRINCITPAAVHTALFDQMSQQHIDYMLSKIPMGRFGLPEEVAAMVAWLASEECSFATGAAFDLSGGRSTY